MPKPTRRFAALTLATTLALPFTTSVAQAQSSIVSSSYDFETPFYVYPSAEWIKESHEQIEINKGHSLDAQATEKADELMAKALDGSIDLTKGTYEVSDEEENAKYYAHLMTRDQADEFYDAIDWHLENSSNHPAPTPARVGVAVEKVQNFHYVTIAWLYDN